MSTFGGPLDTGVGPDEGLALVSKSNIDSLKEYFLNSQPPNTTGLARRLNPDSFYVACRWEYNIIPQETLLRSLAKVTNVTKGHPSFGKLAMAQPIDWGPSEDTGRVADLSPGLAKFLGLCTDDQVEVTLLVKIE
jgi:hypothetical protein